mgnify:CR=1 FL=1
MNMKKRLILAFGILAVAAMFASCDSKLCYCYTSTSQGVMEEEVYTNTDTPCSSLGNSSRGCVEKNERMNPGEIAYK